jgi:hypothetical protein
VEFTRAVGDDSSKYHRPHRQADHGLHYGRFQTERFCGSGSRRVLQSRSSPDSPEGAGSTHQQVRSSGDTPIFTGRSFSKFSVVFCHSVELIERLYLTIVKFPLSLIISTGEKFYQIHLICISRLGFIICSTVKVAVLS